MHLPVAIMPHTVYQYILSSTVYERWNGFLWHGLSFVVKIEFLWTKHKYMCVKLYSCWDKLIVLDQHSCFMNDKINYLGSTWHMPWTQKYRNQISTLYMNDVWEKKCYFFSMSHANFCSLRSSIRSFEISIKYE